MILDDPRPWGPRLGVHASLAVELDWALSSAHRLPIAVPALQELYGKDPGLAARVRELWGPAETMTYPGYLELSLLAHSNGLLFSTDGDVFLSHFEKMCLSAPRDLPLMSEQPSDRTKLLRRLEILRTSPKRRGRYLEVAGEVWSRLRPLWEGEGIRAVEAAIAQRSASLHMIRSWEEFSKSDCPTGHLEKLVPILGKDGELAVVPAYFNPKRLVVDLPGVVVLSVPTASSAALARSRTELLARRLKALSDPTRLAILHALSQHEMSVTEIAKTF